MKGQEGQYLSQTREILPLTPRKSEVRLHYGKRVAPLRLLASLRECRGGRVWVARPSRSVLLFLFARRGGG